MNKIYDNNMKFLPILKFIEKYKIYILIIALIFVAFLAYFFTSKQIMMASNEKAASIYKNWSTEIQKENSDQADFYFNDLVSNHKNTGYTQIALLINGTFHANENNFEKALENFEDLITITNKRNGDKVLNKIARINSSRIYLSKNLHNKALKKLDIYADTSDAYIHELIGDILVQKNDTELAKKSYEKSLSLYSDEGSLSIVTIKLNNIN